MTACNILDLRLVINPIYSLGKIIRKEQDFVEEPVNVIQNSLTHTRPTLSREESTENTIYRPSLSSQRIHKSLWLLQLLEAFQRLKIQTEFNSVSENTPAHCQTAPYTAVNVNSLIADLRVEILQHSGLPDRLVQRASLREQTSLSLACLQTCPKSPHLVSFYNCLPISIKLSRAN